MTEDERRKLVEAMREVDAAVLHALNPFGKWALPLIGLTWAVALPFFAFVIVAK